VLDLRLDRVWAGLVRKETMSQNYQPGQLVRLARTGFSKRDASANDLYEVLRLMPADQTGEVTYRIKSLNAGERAVRSGEVTAYVSPE
jgi:hypothetical protein